MWRWVYEVGKMEEKQWWTGGEGGEACLKDEREGLGFGTDEEEQDDIQGV
jgi:hypothetical protein